MVRDSNYKRDLETLKSINEAINSFRNTEYLREYLEEVFDLNKSYQSRNLKTGKFEFVVLNDVNYDIELNTYEGWIIDNRSKAKVDLLDNELIEELFKY